jgi:hypothetical protein
LRSNCKQPLRLVLTDAGRHQPDGHLWPSLKVELLPATLTPLEHMEMVFSGSVVVFKREGKKHVVQG